MIRYKITELLTNNQSQHAFAIILRIIIIIIFIIVITISIIIIIIIIIILLSVFWPTLIMLLFGRFPLVLLFPSPPVSVPILRWLYRYHQLQFESPSLSYAIVFQFSCKI